MFNEEWSQRIVGRLGWDLEEQEKGRRRVGTTSRVCGGEKLGAGNKIILVPWGAIQVVEITGFNRYFCGNRNRIKR
jgi:hypothetical protein